SLEGHDEPGDVSAGVRDVVLVQVDHRRARAAQEHVLGNVAAVPGAVFNGAGRRRCGFQLSEEPRTLVTERLSEARDLVGPLSETGELPADVHRVAEPGRCGVKSCQPLPTPL